MLNEKRLDILLIGVPINQKKNLTKYLIDFFILREVII
jgi:hypothetical protein